MLHRFLEWTAIEHFEDFVRTGRPLHVHDGMPPEYWETYQKGMRSNAGLSAPEVARRTPVPLGARTMLDLGGSHGLYSVALCRCHPGLSAVVLDLPEAVEHAAPLLSKEKMGERVVHRAGNVLTEDLGREAWDLVFVSHLVHHFDARTNRDLVCRIARSLRPGGVHAILDVLRLPFPGCGGQTGGLLDLFFAVTSESGTWSPEELARWQSDAGLALCKPIRLLTVPGAAIQAATKPR